MISQVTLTDSVDDLDPLPFNDNTNHIKNVALRRVSSNDFANLPSVVRFLFNLCQVCDIVNLNK